MAELLSLRNVSAGYGDAVVLEDISLSIAPGQSWALLGRNGVGKSTLISTIMGMTCLHAGRLAFSGVDITRAPVHQRSRRGIGWVPQERLTFASLSVHEHLTTALKPGYWDVRRIYEALPVLEHKKTNHGKQLSGGEQQMLAIGRALATNPKLLLLDEPLEGLAPIVAQDILKILKRLVGLDGLSVMLVEQHAHAVLQMTDQALVLERGRMAHTGASADLLADPVRMAELLSVGTSA